jgi:hypothetical protein
LSPRQHPRSYTALRNIVDISIVCQSCVSEVIETLESDNEKQ